MNCPDCNYSIDETNESHAVFCPYCGEEPFEDISLDYGSPEELEFTGFEELQELNRTEQSS